MPSERANPERKKSRPIGAPKLQEGSKLDRLTAVEHVRPRPAQAIVVGLVDIPERLRGRWEMYTALEMKHETNVPAGEDRRRHRLAQDEPLVFITPKLTDLDYREVVCECPTCATKVRPWKYDRETAVATYRCGLCKEKGRRQPRWTVHFVELSRLARANPETETEEQRLERLNRPVAQIPFNSPLPQRDQAPPPQPELRPLTDPECAVALVAHVPRVDLNQTIERLQQREKDRAEIARGNETASIDAEIEHLRDLEAVATFRLQLESAARTLRNWAARKRELADADAA